MTLCDTHCHLTHGRLRNQLGPVMERARAAGVRRIIAAAADLANSRAAVALAGAHEDVFATAGVHPHDAKDVSDGYLAELECLAGRPGCVAVGEIGLDYHYDYSPRPAQREAFAAQLDLAARLGMPVVIHTREAFEDTLAVLAESGFDARRTVFHSFTGGPADVRRLLDLGAWISYSGIATFKRTGDIRAGAALVPPERILVETDAPFLAPEPVRNMKVNEPANVAHVAACLAAARGEPAEAFAGQTAANAERFFALDAAAAGA
jgi:TatD DNase family protein